MKETRRRAGGFLCLSLQKMAGYASILVLVVV